MLNLDQERAHALGHGFAQQHADVGIELVHIAHGMHPKRIFADTGVVAQAGSAVVARAGGNLCESLSHDLPLWV